MSFFNIFMKIFSNDTSTEESMFKKIKQDFSNIVLARDLLKNTVLNHKNKTFLISGKDTTLTYEEFYKQVILLSLKLRALDIKKFDHVVLYIENSVEFFISYFAIWNIGAIVIPLNFFLHEKEISFILKDCNPKLIISKNDSSHIFEKICSCHIIIEDDVISKNTLSESETKNAIKMLDDVSSDLTEDDICLLLYTSGTTGVPKGVMLSSKNVIANTLQTYTRFTMINNLLHEKFFCVLPLFHVFAQNTCMWLPLISGSSIIIVKKIDRRLILEGLQHKPTMFMGFPALYGLLCLMKNAPLDFIKIFISGADMLPDKIRTTFALLYGRRICTGYGLTEASPVVAVNYHNHERMAQVVGRPLPGIACQIRDEKGNPCSKGQIGNLWIKGDNIMLGYYKEEKTTRDILVDGWLNTGDLAELHKDGMLSITGRSKDLIIHKGFNIYPQEIENLLLLHPNVIKAAVVGRFDQSTGQVPIAYVSTKEKVNNMESLLHDFCVKNIARYKVPKRIICLDDLPTSSTGKINKKILSSEKW